LKKRKRHYSSALAKNVERIVQKEEWLGAYLTPKKKQQSSDPPGGEGRVFSEIKRRRQGRRWLTYKGRKGPALTTRPSETIEGEGRVGACSHEGGGEGKREGKRKKKGKDLNKKRGERYFFFWWEGVPYKTTNNLRVKIGKENPTT